jgi:hypothetical protein
MAKTLEEVRHDALALDTDARAVLSEDLAVSVFEPGLLPAWIEESRRRLAALKNGEDPGIELDDFLREA